MSSNVEQIKARLSIVDVLGQYLKLEKAGVNYKAKCPFHSEKTPSFFISPSRDTYHCFGCAKGGDIFSFVQEIEGTDFMGSLKILAQKAGVELSVAPGDRKERSEKEHLLKILSDATLAYRAELEKNPQAQEYLEKRGITRSTIERFEIGYAPDGWRVLHDFLRGRGHTDTFIEKTGLIIPSPKGGFYDRFRGRVVFPLHDQLGNVIGFSGRVLTDELPKYINSPQTALFDKSKVLYGIDKAKLAIRKEDTTVLVEGQMDLVLSHQAGIEHTVGVSGTALTDEHFKILGRLSKNLVMAFDADNAGIKASSRALEIALGLGMSVKIALLPPGKDPADLVRENPEEWRERIMKASHVIDFFLDVYGRQISDGGELRKRVELEILPYVGLLASTLDQGHYVSKIASRLELSEGVVWDALRKAKKHAGAARPISEFARQPAPPASRWEKIVRSLLGIADWNESKKTNPELSASIRERMGTLLGTRAEEITKALEGERDTLILEAEVAYEGTVKLAEIIESLFHALQEDLLSDQFTAIMKKLNEAEKSGQQETVHRLLSEIQQITAQLTALKKSRYNANPST